MPSDLEFDFGEPDAAAGSEEPLDVERPSSARAAQRVWVGAGVLVLTVALAVDLVRGHGDTPRASPAPATSSISAPVSQPGLQTALTAIALGPPTTVASIRSNTFGCPRAVGAFPPLPAQLQALARDFPSFTQVESSPVIDGSDGLCEVDFRARNADGDILVVRVQAPPNPRTPSLEADDETGPGAYPYFVGADYTAPTGFRVQVAVVGANPRNRTSPAQINQLAKDAALTW
jgi:hypothetical protein